MSMNNEEKQHTVLVSRTWYIPNSIRSTRPPRKMYMNILQSERQYLNYYSTKMYLGWRWCV